MNRTVGDFEITVGCGFRVIHFGMEQSLVVNRHRLELAMSNLNRASFLKLSQIGSSFSREGVRPAGAERRCSINGSASSDSPSIA